jgi:hypothetical protein
VVTFSGEAADTGTVWWVWAVGGVAVWFVLAFLAATIVGRSIRLADRRSPGTGESTALTTADLAFGRTAPREAAARVRRRAIPLPPLGVALVVIALGLETSGFLTRLTGATGTPAQLLSMDAPFSLPRMFVALLFAAGAVAAVAGAGSLAGRRAWWLGVGLVGGGIAAVKAGSTVHADALSAVSGAVGNVAATLISVALATAIVGVLWFLSRTDRRDRRRVLGVLSLYAVASVGLSAVSAVVGEAYGGGSSWAAGATFLEESGEALAAVAFLMAVLAGVAPRLVLPATWPLRRTVDVHTLDVPEQSTGRAADGRTHG